MWLLITFKVENHYSVTLPPSNTWHGWRPCHSSFTDAALLPNRHPLREAGPHWSCLLLFLWLLEKCPSMCPRDKKLVNETGQGRVKVGRAMQGPGSWRAKQSHAERILQVGSFNCTQGVT